LTDNSFVSETVGAKRALILGGRSGESEIGERERSGERKSNKLVEHGAAFLPAPAPLTCSASHKKPGTVLYKERVPIRTFGRGTIHLGDPNCSSELCAGPNLLSSIITMAFFLSLLILP
jgi:hypothetical protein